MTLHNHSLVMICPGALVAQAQALGSGLGVSLGFEAELSDGWRGFETAARAETAGLATADAATLLAALAPGALAASGDPWTLASVEALLAAVVRSAHGPDGTHGGEHFDAVLLAAGVSRMEPEGMP